MDIKKTLKNMAKYGEGIILNDAGSGSGGPNFGDIMEMMDAGDFDDAEFIQLDKDLLRDTAEALDVEINDTDDWRQIEFNFGDNNYRQIGWVYE